LIEPLRANRRTEPTDSWTTPANRLATNMWSLKFVMPIFRRLEMMAGCPWRFGNRTVVTNVCVNEAGWNCNIPSSIQKAPSRRVITRARGSSVVRWTRCGFAGRCSCFSIVTVDAKFLGGFSVNFQYPGDMDKIVVHYLTNLRYY